MIGHYSSSSEAVAPPESKDIATMTPLCQEDSSTETREPSWPEAITSQVQRSPPQGHIGPSGMSSWQGSAQGHVKGRPTPATTAQSGKEALPSVHGPGTMTTPSWANARGSQCLEQQLHHEPILEGSPCPELRQLVHRQLLVHRSVTSTLTLASLPKHVHIHI